MQKRIANYNVLHFNDAVSKTAVNLVNQFKLSHNLQIPDAIIGAMSIVFNIELFTYNKKDFKYISAIKLY
jgi:predicted nucleic acid-binding protein